MNSSPRYEDHVIAFCTVHNAHIGAVHKVHHTIFGQFLPPLPPLTLRHTSRDSPPKVRHTSRTPPPIFRRPSKKKLGQKPPCTNSVSIVCGGFCSGGFVWKVLSRVVFVRSHSVRIRLLHQKVKHHFKFHVSYV